MVLKIFLTKLTVCIKHYILMQITYSSININMVLGKRIEFKYNSIRCIDCEDRKGIVSFYAVYWNNIMIREPIPLCIKCAREFSRFVSKNSEGKYKVMDIGMMN